MTPAGAPGTAADGFRVRAADHPYRPGPTDPGRRPYCVTCGQERHQPRRNETTPLIPTQRDGGTV